MGKQTGIRRRSQDRCSSLLVCLLEALSLQAGAAPPRLMTLENFFLTRPIMLMIKRIYIVVACLFFIVIVIGFSVESAKSINDKMLRVESIPLHSASGWGYNILVDHKIFIHQEYIPSIVGKNHFFLTKEDAMKTAGLVIEKLIKAKTAGYNKKMILLH